MKLTIRRQQRPRDALDSTTVEETVDVPNGPIFTLAGLTGLVTALVSLLSFWLVTRPDADQKRELDRHNFHAERLREALRVPSADGRRVSVNVLLATGLLRLGDDASRVDSILYLTGKDTLPQWPAQANTPPAKAGGGTTSPRNTPEGSTTPRGGADTTATGTRR